MPAHRPFLAFALVVATLPCACDDATFDAAIIEDDDAAILRDGSGRTETLPSNGGGMWINNGLDDPDVSGLDPRASLASDEGLAPDSPLLLDPSRRDTVRYLVECALPSGHAIEKDVEGEPEPLPFYGAIGLAPEWETEGCDQDCQEWVSACLLARTNVTGQTVQIWVKGDHEALGWEAPEGALLEAGFYGNLFADPEGQYYCKGTHQGIVAAKREGRTCSSAAGAACDFTKLGKCHKPTRCELVGPDGDVPANCRATDSTTYHTVATYVLP